MAGDGIYSATIPGQAANQVVAFYISATDKTGAAARFPSLRPGNNEPVRECVVLFGDGTPNGSFVVYHLQWITRTNVTRWQNLADLSNEGNDCTFVNDTRVIYNMQGRFAGSPYHQDFDTPNGSLCHYKWEFNDDNKFLGATDFNKIHQPGNGPGDDASLQREQCANTFLRALGVPWLYRRFVAVYVNGNRRGTLMEDAQCPGSDIINEHYPNDSGGFLFKMQPWFEMAAAPGATGGAVGFANQSWCNLMPYTTTGGALKTARYRYNFEMRDTPDSANDYTNVFSLVTAANSSSTPNYVANMENLADMENWMRVFAANHAAGNWDSFGAQNAQNLYGYIGTQGTKYSLHMWDYNIVLGNSGSWDPGTQLFTVNSEDPNMANLYNNVTFRRMYWRALQELVNGPLTVANSVRCCERQIRRIRPERPKCVENPASNIEPWLTSAGTSIASQLAAVNALSFTVSTQVKTTNNVAYVTGTAPVNVETIDINGVAYPLTWTSLTGWTVAMPLTNGANVLSIIGTDHSGQPIIGDSGQLTVSYSQNVPSPVGHIVINEIMYNPTAAEGQYVELYNNLATAAFDLSGWQIPAISYTFPAGTLVRHPQDYLPWRPIALVFAGAYGATKLVYDTFSAPLTPGEMLSLEEPVGGSNIIVAQVEYDNVLPWPTNANTQGISLQLIDSHQDNWRAGNWSSGKPSPDAANSVAATLPAFAPLWINEVEPINITGITNSAGQHAPWLEIYNPTTNAVALSNLWLSTDYTDLTNWAFPSGSVITPGQFFVIFADGQTNLSTSSELHTSFELGSSNGAVALSRVYNGQAQVLDYVNYGSLQPDWSYGSMPDGQSFVRQAFYSPTPGSTNANIGGPPSSSIAYNTAGSIYIQSFDSLPDPGPTSVNSANPVTIDGVTYSLANPYDFAFPAITNGSIGGLGLPSLAGVVWFKFTLLSRFGATDGDQTTGGQISFGLPNDGNRALGLLATSTTGTTAFGAKIINNTGAALNYITVQATGELWRQSNLPKTLQCFYTVDPTPTAPLPSQATGNLPSLNVLFPTDAGATGGIAVDGTAAANQTQLTAVEANPSPGLPEPPYG